MAAEDFGYTCQNTEGRVGVYRERESGYRSALHASTVQVQLRNVLDKKLLTRQNLRPILGHSIGRRYTKGVQRKRNIEQIIVIITWLARVPKTV